MFDLKISSLIVIAMAVQSVLATPPACLLACVAQVEKKSSCEGLADYFCLCSSESSAIQNCLDSICPNGDANFAKKSFLSSCGGKASSASSSASSSATSSSSSASSSATSSSSSASASTEPSSNSASVSESPAHTTLISATSSAHTTRSSSANDVSSSSHIVSVTAGANVVGKSFGAAAVIGLVGALL